MIEQKLNILVQDQETRAKLYSPLSTSALEIRLLYLYSLDDSKDLMRCALRTVSLAEDLHPPYVALSYVWGDPSVTANIFVNGHAMNVTTNLLAALRSLRSTWNQFASTRPILEAHHEYVWPIWVDAISIDQGNHEERSQQVQIMRTIYATATLVASWLGEASPEHVAGVEAFDQIHRAVRGAVNNEDFSWLDGKPSLWHWDLTTREPNEAWTSIARILELPYWNRTWTIQEVVVCKYALAVLGNTVLPFSILHSFLLFVQAVEKNVNEFHSMPLLNVYAQIRQLNIDLASLSRLFRVRRDFEDKESMHLSWLVCRFMRRLATDPRDKIFGFLGIANTSIKADYSKSEREIFEELTLDWDRSDESTRLDFLLYSGLGQVRQDALWPTWIPDWCTLQKRIGFMPSTILFQTNNPRPISTKLLRSLPTIERHVIKLSGWVTDEITSTDCIETGETFGDVKRGLLCLIAETLQNRGMKYLMPMLRCIMWDDLRRDGAYVLESFADLYEQLRSQKDGVHVPAELEEVVSKNATGKTAYRDFQFAMRQNLWRRSLCFTIKRDLVAAAPNAQAGDLVAFIPGCSCLVLLRRLESWYVHLGPCYADNFTGDDSCRVLENGTSKMEEFEIR